MLENKHYFAIEYLMAFSFNSPKIDITYAYLSKVNSLKNSEIYSRNYEGIITTSYGKIFNIFRKY